MTKEMNNYLETNGFNDLHKKVETIYKLNDDKANKSQIDKLEIIKAD